MECKLSWNEWLKKKGERYYKALHHPIMFDEKKMTYKEFERKLINGTVRLLEEVFKLQET